MRDHETRQFVRRLRRGGAGQATVQRLLKELADHEADLTAAALAAGLARDEAAAEARRRLGSLDDIVRAVLAERSLLRRSARLGLWSPALATTLDQAALAARPVARWACASVAGAIVTAGTFFLLQLSLGLSA